MEKNIEKDKNKKNRNKRKLIVLIISLITLIVTYISLRGSYLEMKEVGENYLSVFWQNTIYTFITFIVNFVFLFLALFITNKTIRKSLKVFFDEEKKEMPKFPNKSICFVVALMGSILSTNVLLNRVLLCFSNSKFGIKDPIYNFDIAFRIFQTPFIRFVVLYLLAVIVATLAYGIIYSIIILNKSFNGVSRETIRKCNLVGIIKGRVIIAAVLVALVVVLTMVINIGNEKFMTIQLSDGSIFGLYGAGKADVTVKLWGYSILAFLTMFSIMKAYKAIREKSIRRVIGNVMIVPIYLILLALVLALYQLIFIGKDVLTANNDYINKNINNTKQAYNINVDEKTLDYSGTITSVDINSNKNVLENVQIVDSKNVIQDLQSSQSSKGYYSYRNTQLEEYNINGIPTLMYITPREISNSNSSYSGKTYVYTHGYGVVGTYAGKTDEDGYLNTIKKNITDTDTTTLNVKEPRILWS